MFHSSYPRSGINSTSLNANTLKEICKVTYKDFDLAIKRCLQEGKSCKVGKSYVKSAFRNLGILAEQWRYLIMKARDPKSGIMYFFVDKCLPFSAAISCALFQRFSDVVAHLVKWRSKLDKEVVNYLDDFLFLALLEFMCKLQLDIFTDICQEINLPISIEKTQLPTTRLVFLGLLLDRIEQMIFLPIKKIQKGRCLLNYMLSKSSKKVTVKELQQLCGFPNFLGRAVVPGRAFTRRLYCWTKNNNMKPHYHVKVTQEMRLDLLMWNTFLHHSSVLARPFIDFSSNLTAEVLDMYSDSSRNPELGMGTMF